MSYEAWVEDLVRVVETVGAGIMVLGAAYAFVVLILRATNPHSRAGSYEELRRNLGRSILLGLEVLIIA